MSLLDPCSVCSKAYLFKVVRNPQNYSYPKSEIDNVNSQTKKNNAIPENAIWYEFTDTRSGLTTKCVQKLYHTTQTIHLQGGKRFGKTTTTSILADYLEKEWNEIIETEKDKIESHTKMLANLDINKLQENKR